MAMSKQYRFSDTINTEIFINNGTATWSSNGVGRAADIQKFCTHLRNNYIGYKEQDPNTTAGSNEQAFMQYHIDSWQQTTLFMNASEAKVHVEIYELIPHHDLYGSDANNFPVNLISTIHEGELFDDETVESTPYAISYTDPRATPYMAPKLCSLYKIINKRKLTVHAGGMFTVKLVSNNFDADYFNDFPGANGSTLFAKKGKCKSVLIKMYGQLGVVEKDGSKYLRNVQANLLTRTEEIIRGRVGLDKRPIYQDINITSNQNISAPTGQSIVNEETEFIGAANQMRVTTNN